MNQEEIIRQEAKDFFENISATRAIESFHSIKYRLNDFYSSEFKALFLDQIKIEIAESLHSHRDKAHNGKATANCPYEMDAEKLAFYIRQELQTLPMIAHSNSSNTTIHQRRKVFISYSHIDKEYLIDVKRHFKPFLKNIDYWDDTKILPGQKWKEEIKAAIEETKVAILLVSTDFLGSDFISSDELPPLLKAAKDDGASILIVIVKPCLFEEFPDLNQFQALNPPSNPVSKMSLDQREDLWVNLVRQSKRILEDPPRGQ